MRTLLLVRHAKSSWDDTALADRERPLKQRGKRDARQLGRLLAERGIHPDLVLSSPARRALATARAIAKKLDYPRSRIRVSERLYATEVGELLAVLREVKARHATVMLVGHNPELTVLAHRLAPEITHLPTCALAEFAYDASSWKLALASKPERVAFHAPARRDRPPMR